MGGQKWWLCARVTEGHAHLLGRDWLGVICMDWLDLGAGLMGWRVGAVSYDHSQEIECLKRKHKGLCTEGSGTLKGIKVTLSLRGHHPEIKANHIGYLEQ